jgi:hypothetical protein
MSGVDNSYFPVTDEVMGSNPIAVAILYSSVGRARIYCYRLFPHSNSIRRWRKFRLHLLNVTPELPIPLHSFLGSVGNGYLANSKHRYRLFSHF